MTAADHNSFFKKQCENYVYKIILNPMRWRELLVEGVGCGQILEYPTKWGEMGRNSRHFENDKNPRRNLICSKCVVNVPIILVCKSHEMERTSRGGGRVWHILPLTRCDRSDSVFFRLSLSRCDRSEKFDQSQATTNAVASSLARFPDFPSLGVIGLTVYFSDLHT